MKIENAVLEQIWKDRYCKNNETMEENLRRVAKYCSQNKQEEDEFFKVMNEGLFFPAGRTMSNAGIGKDLTLNNCFTLNFVEDSIEDIFDKVKLAAITHQKGGGTGFEFSKLRPKGSLTSNEAVASGVVSFLEVFNAQTSTILQGNRRGANMGILSIYHPDIYDYLECKSFDEGKMTNFNLSIMVDDKFTKAKENNETVTLHYPIYDDKGHMIEDESQWKYTKEVNALDLWNLIMQKAYDTGEYGVFFYDNLNRDNNTWYMETIVTTNPCVTGDTEILTIEGHKRIDKLVDQTVTIWNGYEWSDVVPRVTGHDQKIMKVEFSNGVDLKCTHYHKFILNDKTRVECKDLKIGDTLDNFYIPIDISTSCKIPCHDITVTNIEKLDIIADKVYCFEEHKNHSAIFNGIMTAQCGEYTSGLLFGEGIKTEEYFGACNLGSIFLHRFVTNPFTDKADIDFDSLVKTVNTAVRFLDNIIDINKFPHQNYENYQKNMRTIGLGVTGLADVFTMMNLKYGSTKSVGLTSVIMNVISRSAYLASIELAKEKGEFNFLDREKFVQSRYIQKRIETNKYPKWNEVVLGILQHGIRNARLISVAPTGTLSLTYGENCSSGIEPIFSLEYDRKVKIGGQSDDNIEVVKMRDYAYEQWLKQAHKDTNIVNEDIFATTMNLSVDEHLKILETIAYHTDQAVSKTVNIPESYTFEETKEVYDKVHKAGIKGCTIFRPNAIRQGILTNTDTKQKKETPTDKEEVSNKKVSDITTLEWGTTIQASDDLMGKKKKIQTGCGAAHVQAWFDPASGKLMEVFVSKGGSGSCEGYQNGLSRMTSLALRTGASFDLVIDQLKSVSTCPSYFARQKCVGDCSKGRNCPDSIGNALHELQKEVFEEIGLDDETFDEVEANKVLMNQDVKIKEKTIKQQNKNGSCPDCGEGMRFEGGCNSCPACGLSSCQ